MPILKLNREWLTGKTQFVFGDGLQNDFFVILLAVFFYTFLGVKTMKNDILDKVVDDNEILLNDLQAYIDYMDNVIITQANKNNFDLNDIRPLNFIYLLSFIGDNIYKKNPSLLKSNTTTSRIVYCYDTDKIYMALEVFIRLCIKYNQYFTLTSFGFYSGIDNSEIYRLVSAGKCNIPEKILERSEDILTAMLTDKSLNPMKILPILNYRHRWSAGILENEMVTKQRVSVESMPRFEIGTGFIKPDNDTQDNA